MMGAPNFLSLAILFAWPAIAAMLFSFLPPRRALIAGFVVGWLFLPMLAMPVPFVKFDKHTATSLGAILGVIIFDPKRLSAFKPALIDLPMAIWCFVPFSSAVSNSALGLTAYDGASAAATEFVKWGIPYLLGRVYYSDYLGLRGLAVWLFVGGLIYIPFCMIEVIVSPQLHFMVYGFYQHDFSQVFRGGGYRPMVFMQHGIAVGNMMAAATLVGFWLWWTGSLKTIFKMPVWVALFTLLLTTVAVKSTGALLLALVGLGALFATRLTKKHFITILLCIIPFVYILVRTVGGWDGMNLVDLVSQSFGTDRSLSLLCRFENENLLLEKAMQKSMFGWARHYLVMTPDGQNILSIPDGLWIIAMGSTGIVGLIALFMALNVPTLALLRRLKPSSWTDPVAAGASAFAILLPIHAIDNLLNTMPNPIFILGLGGIAGLVVAPVAAAAQRQNNALPLAMGQRRIA